MEGRVQGDGDKRRGPDAVDRVDEEVTAETGDTVACGVFVSDLEEQACRTDLPIMLVANEIRIW